MNRKGFRMISRKQLGDRRCATLRKLTAALLRDSQRARELGNIELETAMTSLAAVLRDAADDPDLSVQSSNHLIARAAVLSVTFRDLCEHKAMRRLN